MQIQESVMAALFDPALPDGGVLVVSSDEMLRHQIVEELRLRGHLSHIANGGADALQKLQTGNWKTLLLGSELPDLDPLEVAELASRRHPGLEVRFLDPYPNSSSAQEDDHNAAIVTPVSFGLGRREPPISNHDLYDSWTRTEPLPGMVGSSEAMRHVYDLARRVARRATTVLIQGATGTGKELVARALHQLSPRASRPFVVVNCAAIPETLLESELFGYARGAFTGAVQAQAGRISAANGGTLFLDEVGELPLSMQAKLLRFIELKEIQRLGGGDVSRVDARIVAATNSDLARCVADKQFREDLFYRLATFCIPLPRLQERTEDIVPLAKNYLGVIARSNGVAAPILSQSAIRVLLRHSWPGNVRELQLVIERASILAEDESEILPEHISFPGVYDQLRAEMSMRGVAV